ncbi:hypothetical protein BCON_0193g00090 [Botryotinia convoluta]|uniref:Uncharacterized protein n=1 Tax=Botryotinia convoluta TaxID=54673 RepID=A0A4Z1HLV9_9HELO|nr:hypothetical protein BCON_0193g00090 [Botryotinia convoluta]
MILLNENANANPNTNEEPYSSSRNQGGGNSSQVFLNFPTGIEGLSRKRPIKISVSDLESTGTLQGVEPATLKMGLYDVDQGTGIWTIDVEGSGGKRKER